MSHPRTPTLAALESIDCKYCGKPVPRPQDERSFIHCTCGYGWYWWREELRIISERAAQADKECDALAGENAELREFARMIWRAVGYVALPNDLLDAVFELHYKGLTDGPYPDRKGTSTPCP